MSAQVQSTARPPSRSASTAPTPAEPASFTDVSFSDADFEQVRQLLHQHAGIKLQAGKQAMVYSRLSRRLRETGHSSATRYLQKLCDARQAEDNTEWQQFINCLTTNLTSFFRESHHFDALAQDLTARAGRPLRIWCAAASTGEEAYSIAMMVTETLGANAPVHILASDIDTQVLASASRGVYPQKSSGLSDERLKRHFLRGKGSNKDLIRVRPELARMVEFIPFNLISAPWALGENFDLIFCRNVMIYFDGETQRKVLRQLHGVLNEQGLLYVGHSENFTDARELFKLRGKTVYQRL